jgi:CIC family chloride channel protein
MKMPVEIVRADEDIMSVVNKFDHTAAWMLPVIDSQDNFIGFISKTALLNRYRQILKEYSELP